MTMTEMVVVVVVVVVVVILRSKIVIAPSFAAGYNRSIHLLSH
jgi:type II secretory pathway component PulF